MSDQEDSYNNNRSPRNNYRHDDDEDEQNHQSRSKEQIVVPKSKNKLKACMRCHLLKTQEQWISDDRCENCDTRGNIRNYITSKYDNVVSILDPSKSWLRKRIGLSKKIVPGCYAVEVHQRY